jgi:glycosyltransferase involved in cell wall biosynthesis
MKILYLIPEEYQGDRWGGVTTYTLTTAAALTKRGHEVDVVTPGKTAQVIKKNGYIIYKIPLVKPRAIWHRALARLFSEINHRACWMLSAYRFWKTHGPYSIIEYPEWGSSGLLISLFTKQKCVCVLHRSSLHYLKDNKQVIKYSDYLIDCFERMAIMTASAVTSPTRYMLRQYRNLIKLRRFLGRPDSIIPYGVNLACISKSINIRHKTPTILFVGRIEPGKGCWDLFSVFQKLLRSGLKIRLVLVGEDTEFHFGNKTLSYCEYLKISFLESQSKVQFVGRVSQEKLEKYYQAAKIVAVPSLGYENMPFAALDAINYAKPIVGYASGGIPEFIHNNRNGLLAHSQNIAELYQDIYRLLTDRILLRKLIKQNIKDRLKYSADKIIIIKESFYKIIFNDS